jgi:hypothetical protein
MAVSSLAIRSGLATDVSASPRSALCKHYPAWLAYPARQKLSFSISGCTGCSNGWRSSVSSCYVSSRRLTIHSSGRPTACLAQPTAAARPPLNSGVRRQQHWCPFRASVNSSLGEFRARTSQLLGTSLPAIVFRHVCNRVRYRSGQPIYNSAAHRAPWKRALANARLAPNHSFQRTAATLRVSSNRRGAAAAKLNR